MSRYSVWPISMSSTDMCYIDMSSPFLISSICLRTNLSWNYSCKTCWYLKSTFGAKPCGISRRHNGHCRFNYYRPYYLSYCLSNTFKIHWMQNRWRQGLGSWQGSTIIWQHIAHSLSRDFEDISCSWPFGVWLIIWF